jgi:hypothetical protein
MDDAALFSECVRLTEENASLVAKCSLILKESDQLNLQLEKFAYQALHLAAVESVSDRLMVQLQ